MNKPLLIRLAISLGLLVPALLPVASHAGDCGADPVYKKNLKGAPTVGLRIRDIACMEGSKVLTTVPAGTQVQIIGETDGWYKVQYGSYTGWMGASLMKVTGEGSAETVKDAKLKTELGKKTMVGILEKDFTNVKKDKMLQNRLKDKVLLRVQNKGETWYVEQDGSLSQVKMYGKNEFKRFTAELKKEEMKIEYKKEEYKKEERPESKTPYTPISHELVLKATTLPGAVALEWTPRTSEGFDGYKVVRSDSNADLSYPNDGALEFIPNRDSLYSIDGTAKPGITYYYRICAREKGTVASCGNVVKVVARQR